MKITVQIPRVLGRYCNEKLEFVVSAGTVAEVLDAVRNEYPSLYVCICDETARLRQHINLFLNNDLLLKREQFETRLESGDVIYVFQAVSGG